MSVNGFLASKKFASKGLNKKPSNLSKFNQSWNESEFKNTSEFDDLDQAPNYRNRNEPQDERRYQDDEEYSPRKFLRKDINKSRVKTNEDQRDTTKQLQFETDISAIVKKKQEKPFSKYQSDSKDGRTQVEELVRQLTQQTTIQLQNINHLIETFNKRVSKLIEEEFRNFKKAIIDTVQVIFRNSAESFENAFSTQKQKCRSNIMQTRQNLESLLDNLQDMSKDIKTSGWKKVQQELKPTEKQLNRLTAQATSFKEALPITIILDKKRKNAYQQALLGLLEINDDTTSQKSRTSYKRQK